MQINLSAQNIIHLCEGGFAENFAVPITSGSTYNWTINGPSNIANITSGNGTEHILLDLNDTGEFWLHILEIDANLCIGEDSILVKVHPIPSPNIFAEGPISFCEGDSVLLRIDSLYSSFLWNNNANSSYIYADTTANYFVTVTDINGCSNNSNTIFVDAYPSPIANFTFEGLCLDNPATFISQSIINSGQISSSIWYLGNGDIYYGDSISYTYYEMGDYEVSLSVQTDIGCKDSLTQILSINGDPKANFSYNPFTISTLQPEINFINTSEDAVPFLWEFGDSNFSVESDPSHIYDYPGIYSVMLIVNDLNGCKDSIIKHITMYYDFVLYVPTAFTPNNDGDNDTFGPSGLRMEKYISYDFQVYNKWGERIFETTDINQMWSGADFPAEVYNWILIITDELGKVRKENGLVTLIR
jgi:gliding motility-associated-like protein